MDLSESLENYMEAIYHISEKKGAARAKDIAQFLEVNNSSVTEALRSLSKKGLVNYAPYDLITLTDQGTELARVIVLKHAALEEFLEKVLKVEEKEAGDIACKMEHVVSEEVIEKIKKLTTFISENHSDWLS